MKKGYRGFTLTEVLLVSAMLALISLAVFNAFSNGFKLWARGEHVMVEGDTAMFLDRIAEDLRQVSLISGIPFKGEATQLSFPAVIMAPTDQRGSRANEGTAQQLGAIQYTYDPLRKKIFRSQATYGQALKSQWSQPVEVADLIEGISLHYYFTVEHGIDIKDQTDQGIPMGVEIDVQYLVGDRTFHMRRFLVIPVGGGI